MVTVSGDVSCPSPIAHFVSFIFFSKGSMENKSETPSCKTISKHNFVCRRQFIIWYDVPRKHVRKVQLVAKIVYDFNLLALRGCKYTSKRDNLICGKCESSRSGV